MYSRKPVRAQSPNRARVAALDSTPGAPAKSTGKPIPQIDLGLVNVTLRRSTSSRSRRATSRRPSRAYRMALQAVLSHSVPSRSSEQDQLGNIPGALRGMAERLVSKLGGNPLGPRIGQARLHVIAAENGPERPEQQPLQPRHAGHERTCPAMSCAPRRGLVVFSTPEAGLDAAAAEIKGRLPEDRHGHPQGRRRDGAARTSPELELARGRLQRDAPLFRPDNSSGPKTKIVSGKGCSAPAVAPARRRDRPGGSRSTCSTSTWPIPR